MPGRPLLYGGILILCLLLTSMPLRATSFVIGNSRLTFITDHLVRLEYALHQEFLNDSTLFAVVRGEYPVDVNHEQEGRKHVFSTRAMRLEFDNDGFPFGQNNLKVSFSMNGETKHWCLTDGQQGNLKGALTTVDGIGGPTTRQEGLLSRDGWYLIQDTGKDIYRHGSLQPRAGPLPLCLRYRLQGGSEVAGRHKRTCPHDTQIRTRSMVLPLVALHGRRLPGTGSRVSRTRISAGHYGI